MPEVEKEEVLEQPHPKEPQRHEEDDDDDVDLEEPLALMLQREQREQ